jgi:hypothetical protein
VLLPKHSKQKPRGMGCVSMRFTERSSNTPIRFFCDRSSNDDKLRGVVLRMARRVVTTRVSTCRYISNETLCKATGSEADSGFRFGGGCGFTLGHSGE